MSTARPPSRKRAYFVMMGICLLLIVLAWNVVRLWSIPAAVVMSIVAALIPPGAAIVGNWGSERDLDLPGQDLSRPERDERRLPPRGPDWHD